MAKCKAITGLAVKGLNGSTNTVIREWGLRISLLTAANCSVVNNVSRRPYYSDTATTTATAAAVSNAVGLLLLSQVLLLLSVNGA